VIDTTGIIANTDLHELIGRDTQIKNGRAYCPACQPGGGKSMAMAIYDKHYRCHGCGMHGDAIAYVQQRDNVNFIQACTLLGWSGGIGAELLRQKQVKYEQQQQIVNKERELALDQLLAKYTADEVWQAYNRKMVQENIDWWLGRGIPETWQQYLRLGFTADKAYIASDQQVHHSPAYTIPFFHTNFVFKNMQYRLSDPSNPRDRYRFEKGLKTTFFDTTPSNKLQDQVVITEGAIKGVVCRLKGCGSDWSISVLAVPSKVDFGGVANAVQDCGRVYVVLDPDAWQKPANANEDWIPSPIKLARLIGEQSRIITLPVKVDDGFLYYHMSQSEWQGALRQAIKL
jgi:hypothetical protein